jgi:prevent-host-death family protein
MNNMTVSIAEVKKDFSRLIKAASEKKQDIILTRRGKPVAVIIPYDEYTQSRRADSYRRIMEARNVFSAAGIKADDIFRESKKQLEKRL